ncbi:MAG: excisionase family DNA-binding protein [Burkholderiaceae bacterium]|nr:excisionase family DNA-binding protein [Burkholderiaceae bacterium]
MSRPHFAQDPVDPLLTTREAAMRLGVSLRTVQLWVEAGTLPAGRTPGGHRRIRLSAVEALAQRSGLRAAAEPGAAPGGAGSAPPDVLMVAASVDQLQAWQDALQPLGAQISLRGANNGYTGMLQLGRKVPDLLVTDLSMPDIDGYAMLLTLASLNDYASMRVLAITAQSPQYIAERGGLPERVRVLHQPVPAQAVRTWVEAELGRSGRPLALGVVT